MYAVTFFVTLVNALRFARVMSIDEGHSPVHTAEVRWECIGNELGGWRAKPCVWFNLLYLYVMPTIRMS